MIQRLRMLYITLYAAPGLFTSGLPETLFLGFVFVLFLDRAAVQAFGSKIAVDQLDPRHVCRGAIPDACLQHPGVATSARLVSIREGAEQFGNDNVVS